MPRSPFPRYRALFGAALLASATASMGADRPLHLLYFWTPTPTKRDNFYAMLPGQWLAPEAIYFDYRADAAALTPGALKHFDAVFLAQDESKLSAEAKGA